MSAVWHFNVAAEQPLECYTAWLAAWPGGFRRVEPNLYLLLAECLRASEFEPLDPYRANTIENHFHFRPTHSWDFWPHTRDRYEAKLEMYRVAFAFLRDFPDDCYFSQDDSGRFVRRSGKLLVNEAEFTYNEECAMFLRPPSLLTPYQATVGHAPDLEHPDWPTRRAVDDDE